MDWQRFTWPIEFGEPDADWFGYLEAKGWVVNPVPSFARLGGREYLRYVGHRAAAA